MQRKNTIAAIIQRAFLTTCVVFSSLCIIFCAVEILRYRNALILKTGASLVENTVSYYSQIITALLDDKQSVQHILEEAKIHEGLESIDVIAKVPEQAASCSGIEPFSSSIDVATCTHEEGDVVTAYQRLISGGVQLGYIRKTKEINFKYGLLALRLTLPITTWFAGMLLLVFVVKRRLHTSVSYPLHVMYSDPEKMFKNPNLGIRQADEITKLAEALHHAHSHVEVIRKQEAYIEKQRTLEKVTSQVAHDIRSPLSSLKAAAEMLRGHVAGNGDAMDAVNLLQLSSNRLEGIANGLLAKHKGAESGAHVFSIHEVLDELIGELKASPIGHRIEFKKQYHTDALYVSGDQVELSRAIGNIIKNALEAMAGNGEGKPKTLTVSTTCHCEPQAKQSSETNEIATAPSEPRNDIVIRITDTGPGIPADKIPLILQGGHTEGKVDGNGIGTKVVKDVIAAHKGQINIESQVGKGSTFIVTLPLSATSEGATTGMTVTIPYSGAGPICVIDDEPSMREQWRLTLKALGAAANIFTSWEDYSRCHPSLREGSNKSDPSASPQDDTMTTFIVDYHFDNSIVDGLEVIRRLKEQGFTNFVLATAEYWKPAIKEAAKKLGMVLCPKPLPKVVLSQPVQHHQPTPCHPDRGESQNDTTGPSILLIDDDFGIHFSWKMMRKSLGVGNLTMHSNLEEMIAAATDPAKFDLCVIDKNIEGSQFDGARTLEYLRQNGAKTIVLASGETEDDIRKDPQFSTVDGVLKSKVPMTPEELDPFLN